MLKQFAAVLLAGSFVFFNLADEAQTASTAQVRWVTNTVEATQGGRWTKAYANMALNSGAYVRTGGNSRAQIHYADGSIVRLGSRSVARIQAKAGKSVQVNQGKAYFKVQKQNQQMKVKTRTAVATVMGTEFLITVRKGDEKSAYQPMNGTESLVWGDDNRLMPKYGSAPMVLAQAPDFVTDIVVLEGQVGVQGLNSDDQVLLGAGMMTSVGMDQPPQPPQNVDTNQVRNQDALAQEDKSSDNANQGDNFSQRKLTPDNPNQQVQVNQNSPDQNLNTSPTTGELEIIIK